MGWGRECRGGKMRRLHHPHRIVLAQDDVVLVEHLQQAMHGTGCVRARGCGDGEASLSGTASSSVVCGSAAVRTPRSRSSGTC